MDYSLNGIIEQQKTRPVFMTSVCGEIDQVYQGVLDHFNLPYSLSNGNFFPLTDMESKLVLDQELGIQVFGDIHYAVLSYSALYQGKKWAAPMIEFSFPTGVHEKYNPQIHTFQTGDAALVALKEYVDSLKIKMASVEPYIFIDEWEGRGNRHSVIICIPLDALIGMEFTTYGYLEFLCKNMATS